MEKKYRDIDIVATYRVNGKEYTSHQMINTEVIKEHPDHRIVWNIIGQEMIRCISHKAKEDGIDILEPQ